MSYDPCGTQRLEGNDILNRIAKYLEVEPMDLAIALKYYATQISDERKKEPK